MKTTILFGILLAITRIWIGFNVEPESFHWVQAYKDTAHLFMGGLAVSWWYSWILDCSCGKSTSLFNWQWWLFWFLNIVEVSVAIISRM